MSTIITPTHATFKEGEVYVIQLPEEPKESTFKKEDYRTFQRAWNNWNEAYIYARAHPFKVAEKDKEKVKNLVVGSLSDWTTRKGAKPFIKQGKLKDLTEYRIEGAKFEIEEVHSVYGDSLNFGFKQVACLIEDDWGEKLKL